MRTMLLSFKPDVYSRILSGDKIFEHRRTFPVEPVKAYLYVSRPVSSITGIVYLDNRHSLDDWLNEYAYDIDAISRISEYKKNYNYAMEIPKFIETNSISLTELRAKFNFLVPRSYYYIDNSELLSYLEKKLIPTGHVVEHSNYSSINSTQICKM